MVGSHGWFFFHRARQALTLVDVRIDGAQGLRRDQRHSSRAGCPGNWPFKQDQHDIENAYRAHARSGARADWRRVDDGHAGRRRGPVLLRPGRKARVTSTPPPATPAWPRTAPRGRCTPPTTARSTRCCASRTARPWTSASSSPSHRRSRMRADTPTRPRRTRSAPTRTAGSASSTTSRPSTTTSSRRRAADSPARPWAGSTTSRSPTWRR